MTLTQIASFSDPYVAHLAKLQLESAGIVAVLDGEHHVAMDWMISNAVGGVKLLVDDCDQEAALAVLNEAAAEIDDAQTGDETPDDSPGIPCPSCGSTDTFRMRLNRKWVFWSLLLLGIPIPFLSRKMCCDACQHQWPA